METFLTKLAANQLMSLAVSEDLKLDSNLENSLGDTSLLNKDQETGRVSVITLSAVLGSIYGLAFILAVVWVLIVWFRKRSEINRNRPNAGTRSRSRNDSLSVCSD